MNSNVSRLDFPGFQLREVVDSATHEVETGIIEDGGTAFVLTVLRPAGVSWFAVSCVTTIGKFSLWSFRNEDFRGFASLAKAGDAVVIALVGRSTRCVERVVSLRSLVSHEPQGLLAKVRDKVAAAEYLGLSYQLTAAEKAALKADDTRRQAAEVEAHRVQAAAEAAAAAKAAAEKEVRRRDRIRRINERELIFGLTADGRERSGVPVLVSEWASLHDGRDAIVVETFDEDTECHGKLVEYFKVVKKSGKAPAKQWAQPISAERPMKSAVQAEGVPLRKVVAFDNGSDIFELHLYPTAQDIRRARAAGLNGGTYVAVDRKNPAGKYEVHQVHKDSMKTIGLFQGIE